MKKIAIDCRFAASRTGLGRYTRELVCALWSVMDPASLTLFVRSTQEEWLSRCPSATTVTPAPFDHYSIAEQMRFPSLIRRSGCGLLFSPHFNVPVFCSVPFACTVHDLILHRYPNQAALLKQAAYRLLLKHAVKQANAIIAVSRFTASEIASVYGELAMKKMSVIGEGVSPHFHRTKAEVCDIVKRKYRLPDSFFLYVGNAKEHKNVPMLLRAFAGMTDPSAHLVLVTHGREASQLILPPRTILLTDVADCDLPALYSCTRAFITASLYEGFCLPILEARACGCPVIATRRGAIPEVAGPASVLIEPTEGALLNAMSVPPPPPAPDSAGSWDTPARAVAELLSSL